MIDAVIATDDAQGMTCFLRCVKCKTLYVATEGWQLGEVMTMMVWWAKPKPKYENRRVVCTHGSSVERWAGTAWIAQAVADTRAIAHD